MDQIPPRSALYLYESAAGAREREIDRARRERLLQERPPRPHNKPLCRCELCLQWARDIVNAPAPASSP
jgi:hypothetical protein